jgi:hypothetical protein
MPQTQKRSPRRCTKPRPPSVLWPTRRPTSRLDYSRQRRALTEAMRVCGLELRRFGATLGEPKAPPKAKAKPLHPVLAALDSAPELSRLVGRVRLDGAHDDDTMVWADVIPGESGPMLTVYTQLGEDRAREIGAVTAAALRARGWRTRGAGPTIGKAPGKASGVWAANLALAPLSTTRTGRVTLVR